MMPMGRVYQPQEQREKVADRSPEESEKPGLASVGLNGTISSVCI